MYYWHEILFLVLLIINLIILVIFSIPLLLQFFQVFVAFFSVKKRYKKADRKVKFAFIIPAHNEEDVIYDTVKDILENQDYDKDKIKVYVVADNCSDKTKELALKAGAITLERNDPDPAHHAARFPLQFGIDYILKNDEEVELIVHADADNHFNSKFCELMNDAYVTKNYQFLRPFEGSINGTQNFFTKACCFFYAFDSRIGARSREVLHLAQHVQGSGATMSRSMLLSCGGYDATSISDDTDFCFRRLLEGTKAHFVEEAIVYEDMPSTAQDTYARNSRIKFGAKELFKEHVSKMPANFFKTGDFSFLEIPLTYIWLFIGAPFFIWLFSFAAMFFTYVGLSIGGIIPLSHYSVDGFKSMLWMLLNVVVVIAIVAFLLFYVGVSISLIKNYKMYGAKKRREMLSLVFFLPFYLIVYSFSLNEKRQSKRGWEKVKRNKEKE